MTEAAIPLPPRLVAPLSTAMVTTQEPTLRWELAPRTAGALVELCRDRGCTEVILRSTAVGRRLRVTPALAAGTYFWRAWGLADDTVSTRPSSTWQFQVGHRSAGTDTSWGTNTDLDGDGFADLVVLSGPAFSNGDFRVHVFSGGARGLARSPSTTLRQRPRGGDFLLPITPLRLAAPGDLDGDGFADLIVVGGYALIYAGGPRGIGPTPRTTIPPPPDGIQAAPFAAGAGDLDGDGYADLAMVQRARGFNGVALIFRGAARGLVPTSYLTVETLDPLRHRGADWFYTPRAAGDLDADGLADLALGADGPVAQSARFLVYRGRAGGPAPTPGASLAAPDDARFTLTQSTAGDFDGDGYADLVVLAEGRRWVEEHAPIGYWFRGGPRGIAARPSLVLEGFDHRAGFASGDFDGDGFADLAGTASRGVDIVPGSPRGPDPDRRGTLPHAGGPAHADHIVSADFNGDSFADLAAVGSYPPPFAAPRSVGVFYGGPQGLPREPQLTIPDPEPGGVIFALDLAR